jgi:BirA family biotin operon repressor/biotin-[acetyl-CoA-carboxylase] ligase
VGGILVEGRSLATGSAFVLGIGVNVRGRAREFPPGLRETATSLAAETGRPPERNDLARRLLESLDRWYQSLHLEEYGHIARRWRRISSTLGERVALLENGREFRGRVLDLSLEDGLIVRLDEGVTRIFHPSTVTLRQMPERRRSL